DVGVQDVQSKIASAQKRLPRELDPPVITKTNPDDLPIMTLFLYGPRPRGELSDIGKTVILPMIATVPGIGEVQPHGLLARNPRIWVSAPKLAAYGLTANEVLDAIRREHVEVPSG